MQIFTNLHDMVKIPQYVYETKINIDVGVYLYIYIYICVNMHTYI